VVTAATTPADATKAAATDEYDNQWLLALKKKNLPNARRITMINAVKNPKFDVDSPKGSLELAEFSDPVIQAITAKMHPVAKSPARPAVSTPKPSAPPVAPPKKQ